MTLTKQSGHQTHLSKKSLYWGVFFVFLLIIIYSPLSAPYGELTPKFAGIPYTVVMWTLLSVICIISIIIFALHTWEDW
ncbi:hypothetical protein K9M79_08535 [Candidatus Woesearchaeota archaeon]|nr:hypothetical protein [Candidatus Woesearchaeota archaeon]